ncbi:peptidoglycan DD-metalloendopeptidase family protein [Myxococcota bacterium]|nr:peptidoglycan DD-metalloendopeptidase family protein [Myxococcota bacterium]MBU1430646.1 peptidoglycan DD-metalloendopeptidase family protein [Myxococcota bacterium]MBU1897622.1 peptidoglycan DD-metalloendopeptidase family protein [Myxococcota bacterium]
MRLRLACLCLLTWGCSSQPAHKPDPHAGERGVYYTVEAGDTLNEIAALQRLDPAQIIAANEIADPDVIEIGQRLFLPGLDALRPRAPLSPGIRLIWPVDHVRLTSPFGRRGKRTHKGIDLGGAVGTPIKAAAAGVVIYSDNKQRGYGNLVIIQHPGGFETVYAHNHRNRVDEGEAVRQGQRVADLGSTGRSTGPHLHFELRLKGAAINPMNHLPALEKKP